MKRIVPTISTEKEYAHTYIQLLADIDEDAKLYLPTWIPLLLICFTEYESFLECLILNSTLLPFCLILNNSYVFNQKITKYHSKMLVFRYSLFLSLLN